MEKQAYETLKAIEMEEAEHSDTEGQMKIDRGDDLKPSQVSSSRAKSTSTIERMYTDDYGIKARLVRTTIVPVTEFC